MTPKMWVAISGFLAALALNPAPAAAADPGVAPAAVQNLLRLDKNDRILGNSDAPITIIEYASMTCPHCAHFADAVLPELKKKWIDTGKVKLVLRDFPLDEEAVHASMLARCAAPDRFYAFADTFFADQEKWVTAADYRAALSRLAALGGMSKAEADKCLADSQLENQVLNSRLVAARDLGVNATPTFFVNGTRYTGEPTVEGFDKLLSTLAARS